MRAYSQDLRDKVMTQYISGGMKVKEISEVFNICCETIRRWIRRYRATRDYSSKQGVGCGRAVRFTDKKSILEYLELNPDSTAIDVRNAVAPELPMSTFYDTLSRLDITYKKKNPNTKSAAKCEEMTS